MAAVAATPVTPKTSVATPSIYQQAVAQAKTNLAAEQAPVQAEQSASDAYYQQRQADATSEATALSDLLKGIGPAVQSTYDTAAQNQSLLASGFSHGMQDALNNNADNLNATLAKLGAPATIDSKATEAGDLLYGVGGYNPASKFNQEGAGFAAAADLLPGEALLRGQETSKQLGVQGAAAHTQFDQKLADMAGKLPGDVQTNYDKLQTLALNDAKFKEQVARDSFDQALKTANLKLNTDYKNATLQLRGKELQLAADKFAQSTLNQNRNYQLALARVGLQQKSIQLRAISQEFKYRNGGFTPVQVEKYKALAYTITNDAAHAGGTYAQAMDTLQRNGVPLSIAQAYLNAAYPKHAQIPLADLNFALSSNPSIGSPSGLPRSVAVGQIRATASNAGLDPDAVLAVSSQEGLSGQVGDNGTSFGPFQLHVGGAFPPSVWDAVKGDPATANAWAWSPQGISYAMDQIASVAKGLTGEAAIRAIVNKFERSANQEAEVQGALKRYKQSKS